MAPAPPIDVLIPLLLMLSRTPGKSWNDWRNLSPNSASPDVVLCRLAASLGECPDAGAGGSLEPEVLQPLAIRLGDAGRVRLTPSRQAIQDRWVSLRRALSSEVARSRWTE